MIRDEDIRIIGGWVPTLLYPDSGHIGSIDVDVDFLSGKYGGDGENVSKHVDGIKTLPATGGNFAFEFPPTDVLIEYTRSDGALYVSEIDMGTSHFNFCF